MIELYEIINTIISLKYQEDPDGDLPVEVNLTDRTRYYSVNYRPIPYLKSENETEEMHHDAIEVAQYNASLANGDLTKALEAYRFFRKFKK